MAFAEFPAYAGCSIGHSRARGSGRSDDITCDPRYGQSKPFDGAPPGHLPLRSYLAVPVVSHSGEVLGGLFFGHPGTNIFTERDELIVGGIAAQAAIGIDNARLYRASRQVQESLRLLNETLEQRVADEIAERMRTEEALRQAQKMEAVGQLTGGIAHDFNNLLTAICGGADTLERLLPQPLGANEARIRRALRMIDQGAQRAATLTQRLLAFARRQALDPRPVDANKLVAGMSELLRRTLGEAVAIETVLAGGLWRTMTDPNQLESAPNSDAPINEGPYTVIQSPPEAHLRIANVRPGQCHIHAAVPIAAFERMSMSSVPCRRSIRFLYGSVSLIDVDTLLPMEVDCLLGCRSRAQIRNQAPANPQTILSGLTVLNQKIPKLQGVV